MVSLEFQGLKQSNGENKLYEEGVGYTPTKHSQFTTWYCLYTVPSKYTNTIKSGA